MDIIYIKDLQLATLIGVYPEERKKRQTITLNIKIYCDLRKAGKSDNLNDTIDYKNIEDRIADTILNNEYFLIERVAELAAEICLETEGVNKVNVKVEKAGTLTYAHSAIVEIERS